jgi:hypothetical protein
MASRAKLARRARSYRSGRLRRCARSRASAAAAGDGGTGGRWASSAASESRALQEDPSVARASAASFWSCASLHPRGHLLAPRGLRLPRLQPQRAQGHPRRLRNGSEADVNTYTRESAHAGQTMRCRGRPTPPRAGSTLLSFGERRCRRNNLRPTDDSRIIPRGLAEGRQCSAFESRECREEARAVYSRGSDLRPSSSLNGDSAQAAEPLRRDPRRAAPGLGSGIATRRGLRFYVAFTGSIYAYFTDSSVKCRGIRNLLLCSIFRQ